MRQKTIWLLSCVLVLGMASLIRADDPTSKFVSLAPIPSTLTPSSTSIAVQFEVWNQATAGTMVFSEAHTVDTDGSSNITNDTGFADLLLGRPTGLDPANFQAGSSRYLDVTVGGTTQLSARIPVYATPFSLNPGPQGPPGEQGPKGDQGPAGVVQTVTNADTSISVTGTPQDRSVAVAANGITNANVADGALSPAKITGIAAILGPNVFGGDQSVLGSVSNTGNLSMANSTSTAGNMLKGGALFLHNFGTHNTFLGGNAGNLTMTGNSNTGSGFNALAANTTGSANTASGATALAANTTGANNTASGFTALYSNTTGSYNTASGYQALYYNCSSANPCSGIEGFYNTASGVQALYSNTTGFYNTASGFQALYSNTIGEANTASGYGTLTFNTTGDSNTASGAAALHANTTGANNTASGANALLHNLTGSRNTAIGSVADVSVGDLFNATAIGADAVVNASNKIRLGNAAVTLVEAEGDFYPHGAGMGIILKSPNGAICERLSIDNNGALVLTAVTCP